MENFPTAIDHTRKSDIFRRKYSNIRRNCTAAILGTACNILIFITSCSTPVGNEVRPDPRPGETVTVHVPASLRFAPESAEITLDDTHESGTISTVLQRNGEWLPDTVYSVSTDDAGGFLQVPASVRFSDGQKEAVLSIGYSISLKIEESYSANVSAQAAAHADPVRFRLNFHRPSQWSEPVGGTYRSAGTAYTVSVRTRRSEGSTEYEVTSADGLFTRQFTLYDDGSISIKSGAAGIDGFADIVDSRNFGDEILRQRLPIYRAKSVYDDSGCCFGLNITYTDTDAGTEPRYDFLTFDSPDNEWINIGYATFHDGWLLGIVSFEARPPLDPAENPWPVFMQRNRNTPGIYRACAVYREASPLSQINSADGQTYLIIDAQDGHNVSVHAQFSGFGNTDLFGFDFIIGGSGEIRTTDNNYVIYIDNALHNGYGAYGETWARHWPCTFTFPAEP